tara:strand:- start:53 stop:919 length:867 start_codon:yes stop_codon:yes gene_type:complete
MSTYVNNLRLEEIGSGERSGTWGTATNTNLELIGEAFGYGTEALSDASTATITMADAISDGVRSFYLKLTGALGQNCTVTLAPNTVSKIWIIENATTDSGSSGPYSTIIKQGSGATVTIPNGKVKVVVTDGGGASGIVYDAFTDLSVAGTFDVAGAITGASTISGTTITASTALVPDASGGADIGTTSLEWGDVYIADDKKIKFGNDQDVSIEYDEDGTDTLLITGNSTFSGNATIADGTNNFTIASHDGSNGLVLGSTLVTVTATEINAVTSKASTGKAIAMAMVFG